MVSVRVSVDVRPRESVTVTVSVMYPARDRYLLAVKDAVVYVTPSSVAR